MKELKALFLLGLFSMILPVWGQPNDEGWINLIAGNSLNGWMLRHADGRNGWRVENGVLINQPPSTDIVHVLKFQDHELHIEFMVPPGSNSGVYIQGRYEIQIDDAFGRPPSPHMCGAVYGRIAPKVNASKRAGEWQTFDVKFIAPRLDKRGKVIKKARITVIHNGVTIIDNAEIDGITGGALEGQEGIPGGLMLQGDHGPIQYRNIRIHPLRSDDDKGSAKK